MLGVIGGLGPMATAYFMQLVTTMTDAENDQAHLPMLVYSVPTIPDRTAYILGESSENPVPGIVNAGKALGSLGADVLAIPCITAHCFHSEIEKQTGIRTLHTIREGGRLLSQNGVHKVGIMATDGTVKCGLFQKEFASFGIETVFPSEKEQKKVMDLIYRDIKKGNEPCMEDFFSVKKELTQNGAELVLLGCTELSLIKKSYQTGRDVLDMLEVLSACAVCACGKKLRPDYRYLEVT